MKESQSKRGLDRVAAEEETRDLEGVDFEALVCLVWEAEVEEEESWKSSEDRKCRGWKLEPRQR